VDISVIRAGIPALKRMTYLNTGTYGPLPSVVADEVVRLYRLIEAEGAYNRDVITLLDQGFEKARAKVADLLGATPEEIALTRNVSEGINIVAGGFTWQPEDEVVISNEEHSSGTLPWLNLARRQGIVVKVLHLQHDPARLLDELDQLIGPRTRLVFLSHVSCISGMRLPAKEVCEVVHRRGIPIMFDGAHAVGQFPVDVQTIGCDFYAGCGHKWLSGPQGTGFLYIRQEHLDDLELDWCGWGSAREMDLSRLWFEPQSNARRFEFGTRPWALYPALGVAIDRIRMLGLAEIEAQVKPLATVVKERLLAVPWARLKTPLDPTFSCGLVSFETEGIEHEGLSDWLWQEHRIMVGHNAERCWLRLSLAYFTLPEEVDRLLELLEKRASSA